MTRWRTLRQIEDHLCRAKLFPLLTEDECKDMLLPTYIINLKQRKDRLENVLREFEGKLEFDINVIQACQDPNGAVGLWKSIRKIIKKAKTMKDEVILLCEDDHIFSSSYDKKKLFSAIYQGAYLGADLILGGVTNTRQAIPVNENLCWIDFFKCTQFTIIFNRFFDEILSVDFQSSDAADLVLSNATANKYVLHPFISVQKDFGYSDIPLVSFEPKERSILFDECEEKIHGIRRSFRNESAGGFSQLVEG